MTDTTTTLNPGVGGDVMDESLVTQTDGTAAKRPRVEIGLDGKLLGDIGPRLVVLPTADEGVVQVLQSIDGRLAEIVELLRTAIAE